MAASRTSPPRIFDLPRTDRVVYGAGARTHLRDEARRLGITRPLVVASGTLTTETPFVHELAESVGAVATTSGIPAHVPRAAVLNVAERFRELDADGLISVGGGSPVDCAKGVALCVAASIGTEADFDSYRIRYRHPGPPMIPSLKHLPPPHISLPTTLSGAEFTAIAGITDIARGAKDLYAADALCPKVVLLDSEIAARTPRALWVSSGVRAIDHIVEGVYSARHTPVTDAALLGALRILARDLPVSADAPDDLSLRTSCQVAAWMAIMHLKNISTGISHGLGHQLGAMLNVPHGVTSCILLPHAMDFNRPVTADRQALLASALGVDTSAMTDEQAAVAAAGAVRALLARMGVPTRLSDVGVQRRHFDALVAEALADMVIAGNPRPVTAADARAVLEAAF
ncbi:alcohol dehydrogenase, class IV [Nocardia nova SH22a]|uniref:Alcohol dehydrogenase, class IV n=1 Tax=Nocardia nova SH22a TaxID=1415166 RepID=W5TDV2_9NOCA|nr:iron-containing alcohol dehydrogenase [Nocardia nova]AHH17520.1 alcohol dehydrogenase, class IV [Nocardia nova SH22a]